MIAGKFCCRHFSLACDVIHIYGLDFYDRTWQENLADLFYFYQEKSRKYILSTAKGKPARFALLLVLLRQGWTESSDDSMRGCIKVTSL